MPAFDTPSGLPLPMVNLKKREGVSDVNNQGLVSTAEVATLQLEFRYLSFLTDNDAYWDAVERVREAAARDGGRDGSATSYTGHEDDQGGDIDHRPRIYFHGVGSHCLH